MYDDILISWFSSQTSGGLQADESELAERRTKLTLLGH